MTTLQLTSEIANDKIYSSFIKLLKKDQEGENDYTTGAIQAVNALEHAITKLIVHAMKLEKELEALKK